GLDDIVYLESDLDGSGNVAAKSWPLYDASGNVVLLTDGAGKPLERYDYTPYGAQKILVNSTPPAVQQVRVVGGAVWVELSEAVQPGLISSNPSFGAATPVTLFDTTADKPFGNLAASQPVTAGDLALRRIVITSAPPTGLHTGDQVTLTIPAVALVDSFLNQPAQDYALTFAWPASDAVVADSAAPTVQRLTLRQGSLELELTAEPNLAAATAAIQLDGAALAWTLGADHYTLTSTTQVSAGAHTLTVGTTLTDLGGTPLAASFSQGFTAAQAQDSQTLFVAPDPQQSSASAVGNLFGYQGLPRDPETGLIYFRNRYYDPELGRFITADPKGYVDGSSMYAFEEDDPANGSDPMGLEDDDQGESLWDKIVGFFTGPVKKGVKRVKKGVQNVTTVVSTANDNTGRSRNNSSTVEEINYPADEQNVQDLGHQTQNRRDAATVVQQSAEAGGNAVAAAGHFLDAAARAQIARAAYEAAAAAGKSLLERQVAAQFAVEQAEREAAVKAAAKQNELDWDAVVPKKGKYKGEKRADHVRRHEVDNPNKPAHGVFLGDGVGLTNEAWARAQQLGLKPSAQGVLTVPMGRQVGWAGGQEGSEAAVPLSNVTIIVKPGTNQIITAYPTP
ncbi:MAG TPA: RHS repeat-associated core domain-containing protein, partial [Thermoanaerobaculia bacterium]|nr:RHS repeat-associated core domain-containing protein [Thermoanaerobaculia bacterium]